MNSSQTDHGELVIFQPALEAYPTRHSWIITSHVSLGNLEHHWKLFTRQLTRHTTISQLSGPTSICSNAVAIHTSTRIIQHTVHLQVQSVHHNFCHTITEFQPTTCMYTMQEMFTAFSWRCPQLAYRNCHHKRHSQHQNMNKPTHCHAHITMQHPGPYCVNIEHHQVHHTG